MSIMEKFKLDGKVALVTGCSKGIGFGIAKGLAEAGADIIGVSSTLKKGSEIEKYVESIGKRFHCFNCDFSERENTHSFLHSLKKNNLEPNILLSNAGSLIRTELSEHSDEHWDRIMEINLSSQFVLARELSSKMVERGWGKIIFTASILSYQGGLFVPSYTASKGGIASMAEGGMMDMGGMEMDLRGGGFVPMGRAEKADDVPARLSKNEFVFTADAVRAAGGGDVDKGADKMYATMKKLEDRVA